MELSRNGWWSEKLWFILKHSPEGTEKYHQHILPSRSSHVLDMQEEW
jgi:hypothetical protein